MRCKAGVKHAKVNKIQFIADQRRHFVFADNCTKSRTKMKFEDRDTRSQSQREEGPSGLSPQVTIEQVQFIQGVVESGSVSTLLHRKESLLFRYCNSR